MKFLLLILLCSILPINGTINNGTSNIKPKLSNNFVSDEFLIENEKCVELANEFENMLENYNKTRSVVYSNTNEYAGIYIDDNNVLNINQTFGSGTDYMSLAQSINDEEVEVQVNNVEYSLDNLLEVKKFIDVNLSNKINSMYISQEENKIFVCVLNQEDINYIDEQLSYHFSFYEQDIVEYSVEEEVNTLTNSIKAGQKIQYDAGWWIFHNYAYGTVGFNAVDADGNRGVVTNYHVAP